MMTFKRNRFAPVGSGFFVLALLLSACSPGLGRGGGLGPRDHAVTKRFSAFYGSLYGAAVLGPAISPQFEYRPDVDAQYTEAGLMLFDRQGGYRLAPLGVTLGYTREAPLGQPGAVTIDGYLSNDQIRRLYDVLKPEVVGRPLTNLRINPEQNRVEQYFENLALAAPLDDLLAPAYTLPYGLAACPAECRTAPEDNIRTETETYDEPFHTLVETIGRETLGQKLAGPYALDEGGEEIVFENGVLYSSANGQVASLRPIPEQVGVQRTPPVRSFGIPQAKFIAVDTFNNLGYDIPMTIFDYIEARGGLRTFGMPITTFAKDDMTGIYSQCFQNFCLLYDPSAPDDEKVRPQPLGQAYRALFGATAASNGLASFHLSADLTSEYTDEGVILTLTAKTLLALEPGPGIPLRVRVEYPDGSRAELDMGPTNENGDAFLRLAPLRIENGKLMYFEICTTPPSGEICVKEEHLFWGN